MKASGDEVLWKTLFCLATALYVSSLDGLAAARPTALPWQSGVSRALRQTLAKDPTRAVLQTASVVVAIKTQHFFGEYARDVPGCMFEGKPLACQFVDRIHQQAPEADALWFHIPTSCGSTIQRDAPHQLTVGMSMEASTYYQCMSEQPFMDNFDIEMTYRKCSHVFSGYFVDGNALKSRFFQDPLPWDQLQHAVAYINSNCGALNGRNEIVARMMQLEQLPVHAWGACLRNQVAPQHNFDKIEVFRQYKFCISMENSNTLDYVTEKIWHALEAGCVPIYYGAPNIQDFVPLNTSIIDYRDYGTPEKLMEYLVLLSNNKALYDKHHAWRHTPFEQLSPGFRKMVLSMVGSPHSQCQVCALVMAHKVHNTPLKNTHCLRNASWMEADRTGGSTWAPGSDDLFRLPNPLVRSPPSPPPVVNQLAPGDAFVATWR